MTEKQTWRGYRQPTAEQLTLARAILAEVQEGTKVTKAIRHHPLEAGGFVGKNVLVEAYRQLTEAGEWAEQPELLRRIRMKPTRTLSGVTTVTVLTKPYPCPGKCVFCPTDVRMPKSYLPDEPGAMRALHHEFDPFEQTRYRMEALERIGHPTDKIELLVLGGTWSSYRRDYQQWFLQRCLDAMNEFESSSLEEAMQANAQAPHRNVGLVVETRPDHVDREEIAWLRHLGVTKIQMGAQSLDDEILKLNRRGHTVAETRRAVRLLRAAGFKIVLHWMPNLLGATLQSDRDDFSRLWVDRDLKPDELKIYPNQLLEQSELYEIWQDGGFKPYTTQQLIDLLADIKPTIPRYCRVNRIIRDFPSTNVVEGNKRTSLRQDAKRELARRGDRCLCIRCREVRGKAVGVEELSFQDLAYPAGAAEEHFFSYNTPGDKLAGFLRLSLPELEELDTGLSDLKSAALIREVHVYGQSLEIGDESEQAAQHQGLGTDMVNRAENLARARGYRRMAIIAALGTRGY
ncbi:MAG: elongator complex protein 3, partial [Anaerolineales bacterium]